jgi:type II secretory pathway predicted ATPase ExeA
MSDRVLQAFNLHRAPFTVDIAPEGMFRFASFQQGILRLEHAARQRSAILVVGEPGTGKTAMVRNVVQRLSASSYCVLEQLVPCTKTPIRAVVEGLLAALGEPLPFNNPPRALQHLKQALLGLNERQRTPVLILDDIHHMSQSCWLVLKSLISYELDSRTPLVLLLMGNPSALRGLSYTALEEVRDRLSSCFHLKGLLPDEVGPYLKHRLQWAGTERPIFPADVITEIAHHTQGLPRRVNRLANALLLTAANKGRELVDHECLQIALSELQFQAPQREESIR